MFLLLLLLLLSLGGSQSQEKYRLQVSQWEMVQEGLCIYIPCTFFYPVSSWIFSGKIYGYWFRKRPLYSQSVLVATNDEKMEVEKEAMGRFHLVGDTMKDNCSLKITDVQIKDSGQYFFRMESLAEKYSYLRYLVNLDVRALTQKPDIFIPMLLEPGRPVTLLCAATWVCREGTPPTFFWTGDALFNLTPSRGIRYFSELTLTPRPRDHGSNLTCRMKFPGAGVGTETTVRLNVTYSLRNFGITVDRENGRGSEPPPHLSILKDESVRLLCRADSNPPALLSWAHEGQVLLSSRPSDKGLLVLSLPRLGAEDGGEYSCQAQQGLESQRASLNLSVLYAPQNLKVSTLGPNRTAIAILGNASSLVVLVGESLQLECVADSSPPAYMNWSKGSQSLNSSLLPSPGILGLELFHVQPEDGGEYTCQARNPWGTQHISLNLDVQYRASAAGLEFSKGALLGAGIGALLVLCLMLAYKKFLRKKQLEPGDRGAPDSQTDVEVDYVNVDMKQGRVPRRPPPDPVTQAPQEELHYASINFRRPNPKSQETDTEYSELKF